MKVAFISSEVYPFSKTGGLADVAQSLPAALNKKGINTIIITPFYSSIDKQKFNIRKSYISFSVFINFNIEYIEVFETEYKETKVYFFSNKNYFQTDNFYEGKNVGIRFALFSYAAIELCKKINFKPDIFHLNDWQTSLISVLLKTNYLNDKFFHKTKTLLTIHNLAYQGYFPKDILSKIGISPHIFHYKGIEFYGQVNFLKGGIVFSDFLNTVSPSYANEILTYEAGRGLDGILKERKECLYGILNGIDYEIYNPETDKLIFQNYNPSLIEKKLINKVELQKKLKLKVDSDTILFSFIGRLTEQKGIELVANIIENFKFLNVQTVILGEGDVYYKNFFKKSEKTLKGKFSANFTFDEKLARQIYAASDFFLMPSLFEPCGISQLISMRYGTIPIVREVGGLKDTVDSQTGLIFKNFSNKEFFDIILKSIETYYSNKNFFKKMQINCMLKDFSWESSANEYIRIYKKLLN
jgi:starch synthase